MAYSQDSKHSKVAADAVVAFEIDVIRVCRQRLLVIFFLYDTMQYVYVRWKADEMVVLIWHTARSQSDIWNLF